MIRADDPRLIQLRPSSVQSPEPFFPQCPEPLHSLNFGRQPTLINAQAQSSGGRRNTFPADQLLKVQWRKRDAAPCAESRFTPFTVLGVGIDSDPAPKWRVDEFDRGDRLAFACDLFGMWEILRHGESNDDVRG
jgi:hypothetical protein